MVKAKINSVRALAHELGISHTTVSDALRNNPRVSHKTRERVKKAARDLQYSYNPLAGAIMSEIRKSSIGTFRGTAAIVDIDDPANRSAGARRYHLDMCEGAMEAAHRLGFKTDKFSLKISQISVARLNEILLSRGIRAVMFLPALGDPELSEMNWGELTGIYADYIIDHPPIDFVCPDHFRSMTIALRKLMEKGYQRPGLVLEKERDKRLLFRWEAGFTSYWSQHHDHPSYEMLLTDNLTKEVFSEWFEKARPDVVLCHKGEILQWMEELGCDIPETCGYCCLNLINCNFEAAGLDLLPKLHGKKSMEALIAQLLRNESGIPETPTHFTYAAKWVDGPTLRPDKV